jgi:hypothetical protein
VPSTRNVIDDVDVFPDPPDPPELPGAVGLLPPPPQAIAVATRPSTHTHRAGIRIMRPLQFGVVEDRVYIYTSYA